MDHHNGAFCNMKSNKLYDLFVAGHSRIVTDSRIISRGDIFFALRGENYNGNDFAADALLKGARLAVVDDPAITGDRIYHTDNTLAELQSLAARYRESFEIPLLAVTGSNGKTTTKELIRAVMLEKFRVHSTSGNLNNHIGVPLTILSAPADTSFMLIEMGANHGGEIDALCNIAKPGFGIVTNIGRAHLEGFGSPEGVIAAKSELYRYLEREGGIIFFNGENSLLSGIVNNLDALSFPYSEPGNAEVKISGFTLLPTLQIELEINKEPYTVVTRLFGKHNIENVLAAVACGLYFEIPADRIIRAIGNYNPDNNRSQFMVTKINRVICDSYNANPSSMMEAINSFISVAAGKRTLILGDMLELGAFSDKEHKTVVEAIGKMEDCDIYLVGPHFSKVAAGTGFRLYNNVSELYNYLLLNPIKDNFVLVKGSRGINLEKVYPLL